MSSPMLKSLVVDLLGLATYPRLEAVRRPEGSKGFILLL
jgi:hypothetical protein